jgi:hypothetical protein
VPEAAALLERACRRPGLPVWRLAGWLMRRAEALNSLGEVLPSLALYEQALAQLNLDAASREGSRWRDLVPALLAAVRSSQWMPPETAEREGLVRLLLRSLLLHTEQLSFTPEMNRAVRINILSSVLAHRLGRRAEALGMRVMSSYGMGATGAAWLARRLLASTQPRLPLREDPVSELFVQQGVCAVRLAQGQWSGIGEQLHAVAEGLEHEGSHRHAMECRSLMAKLLFYQGRLVESARAFEDCTERSLSRPGGTWRAWGPYGLAEVHICMGRATNEEIRRWFELGSYWMTEMLNVDAAYVLRRIGLMARLALREGDLARARETVLGGADVASRIEHCGFWAHEGLAGMGEVLVHLRREQGEFGSPAALEQAWAAFHGRLVRHGRCFPAGAAMVHRLQGEWDLACGRPTPARRHLERAARDAERQGMMVELARSCQALAGLEAGALWRERAQRLWGEMQVVVSAT